jgi:diguanylate cyclase (GGDEF)-like protein/PAS domain S-box-containing protein
MGRLIAKSGFLQHLIDAIPALLFIVDDDVRVLHLNAAASSVVGPDKKAVLLKRGGDVLHCIYANETPGGCGRSSFCSDCVIRNAVGKAFQSEPVFNEKVNIRMLRDGRILDVWFSVTANSLIYGDEKFVLLVMEDITGQKRTEDALRESENRLRTIVSVLGEGVFVIDAEGRLVFMNPEAERLLGWTQVELLEKNIHDIIHFQKADGTRIPLSGSQILRAIRSGKTCRNVEEVLTGKDGVLIPVSFVCNPIIDNGKLEGFVAAFHDMTAIKQAYEALNRANELLEHQATTDPLTGVYNRLKFDDILHGEISRSRRHRIPLSLVMLDIDHFKAVNDTYGHHAGDLVLQQLTDLIAKELRRYDHFARWGGEEFMILFSHNALKNAGRLAEKFREKIENYRFSSAGRVTCSFGVTQLVDADDFFRFTRRVDDALYRAKALGRNRVEVLAG